jgi:hypothetical protein
VFGEAEGLLEACALLRGRRPVVDARHLAGSTLGEAPVDGT